MLSLGSVSTLVLILREVHGGEEEGVYFVLIHTISRHGRCLLQLQCPSIGICSLQRDGIFNACILMLKRRTVRRIPVVF